MTDVYVPDPTLARQSVAFDQLGTLFLFEVHDSVKFPRDPSRDEMARLLRRDDGEHRNVFLVAWDGTPIWRVGDYKHFPNLPDQFVQIWKEDSKEFAYGWTFHGYRTQIRLSDGAVLILEWTK